MDIISIILAMALLLYVKDIITTKQIIVCIIVCILFKLNRSKRLFEGMTDSTATDELNNESLANISSLYNGDELIVNKLKVTGDVEIGGKTTMSDSLKINAATGSSGISITGGGFENNLVRSAHYIKQGSNDVYKNDYGTIYSKVLKASDYVLAGDGSKHHIYMQSDQSAGKSYIKSKNNNTFGPVYIGTGGTNIANSGTITVSKGSYKHVIYPHGNEMFKNNTRYYFNDWGNIIKSRSINVDGNINASNVNASSVMSAGTHIVSPKCIGGVSNGLRTEISNSGVESLNANGSRSILNLRGDPVDLASSLRMPGGAITSIQSGGSMMETD